MILFKYVLRDYFKFVFAFLLISVFLFLISDFIYRSDFYFEQYNPSISLVCLYYLTLIPTFLLQLFPLAALLASVTVMTQLNNSNEVTAMRAAGMTPKRIIFPLFIGGVLLTGISYLFNEWVVPYTSSRNSYIQYVEIEGLPQFDIDQEIRWLKTDEQLLNFSRYDRLSARLHDIRLLTLNKSFRVKRSIHAKMGEYEPSNDTWVFHDVNVYTFGPGGELQSKQPIAKMNFHLPVQLQVLVRNLRSPETFSISELRSAIQIGEQSGTETQEYKVILQVKYAFPFACILVSLLGISFGYRFERVRSNWLSVLKAVAYGLLYWIIMSLSRAVSFSGDLSPFLGAWIPNVMIFLVFLYEWRTINR